LCFEEEWTLKKETLSDSKAWLYSTDLAQQDMKRKAAFV
jgi:hypothetical protein